MIALPGGASRGIAPARDENVQLKRALSSASISRTYVGKSD